MDNDSEIKKQKKREYNRKYYDKKKIIVEKEQELEKIIDSKEITPETPIEMLENDPEIMNYVDLLVEKRLKEMKKKKKEPEPEQTEGFFFKTILTPTNLITGTMAAISLYQKLKPLIPNLKPIIGSSEPSLNILEELKQNY